MRILLATLLCAFSLSAYAGDIDAKVEAALAAESRPEADRERDRNRRPLETLNFFGLEDDMRVLELIPGGGWYTRILAPVLADEGKLYLAIRALRSDSIGVGLSLYFLARTIFNALRSIEPLIMVIVFAVWVGIDPFAAHCQD